MAAARIGDRVLALGRAGDLAERSRNPARRLWARFVAEQHHRFLLVLNDGERLAGEWLALAHGTRYALPHEPFVAFDLLRGHARAPHAVLRERAARGGFTTAAVVHQGGPLPITGALELLRESRHGALDPIEGAVWRVERGERVDLVAKYVRWDKRDGCLLPEATQGPPLWNWLPPRGVP